MCKRASRNDAKEKGGGEEALHPASLRLYSSRPSLSPDRHRGLHSTNYGVIDKRTKGGMREDAGSEVFIPPRACFKEQIMTRYYNRDNKWQ
ncbi:uncharacterized protein TrAtP1_010333 [Trichoderma atroviride]|uniref:uncharacterized protein n=1 Tax=Hypocrea atroviridis TaxID=63577 RepID=UPI00331CB02E|nr:hypothetical protein TrAtP1_010333 [Trichoderma atroviride]